MRFNSIPSNSMKSPLHHAQIPWNPIQSHQITITISINSIKSSSLAPPSAPFQRPSRSRRQQSRSPRGPYLFTLQQRLTDATLTATRGMSWDFTVISRWFHGDFTQSWWFDRILKLKKYSQVLNSRDSMGWKYWTSSNSMVFNYVLVWFNGIYDAHADSLGLS